MKKINYCIAFFLIVISGSILTSCQKSTVKPQKTVTGPLVGYWYGSFINNNGFGAPIGILFRSDGTVKLYDFFNASSQTDTTKTTLNASGTYSVSGNIVTFDYTFPGEPFTAQGTINTSTSPATMPYTFTDPSSVNYSGTANVSKQSN